MVRVFQNQQVKQMRLRLAFAIQSPVTVFGGLDNEMQMVRQFSSIQFQMQQEDYIWR